MNAPAFPADLVRDVSKRRTFAIISHPDAGKTTLTEKLLLYGGAIQMAGTVKSRKSRRHAMSDCITELVTEIPRCFSTSIQSDVAWRRLLRDLTVPAIWIAPP